MTNLEWVRAKRSQEELKHFLESSPDDPEKEGLMLYHALRRYLSLCQLRRKQGFRVQLDESNVIYMLAQVRAMVMDEKEKA